VHSITTQPVLAHGRYTLDPDHSTVGFSLKHMVVSTFRGGFDRFDAWLVSDDSGVRIEGTVEVASVAVKNKDLAEHLQSPDFFDAATHPELRFVADRIRRNGDEVVVDGELTLRGTTLPVTATGTISDPAEDAYGDERMGIELVAVIDRRAYGLDWNEALPKGGFALANDVKLRATLALVKEA